MKRRKQKSLTRLPKSYLNLPKYEQEAINKAMQDEFVQMVEEEEVNLFTQYTKMMCILMHDYNKDPYGEKRLTYLIGNFRMLHRKFRKLKTAKEINEALDKEMARLFPHGFPQEFVENLQREK